jgi:hypothetical protein
MDLMDLLELPEEPPITAEYLEHLDLLLWGYGLLDWMWACEDGRFV